MIIQRNTLPILSNIFSRISDTKFDINTQYKLLKIKKAIDEEEEIYQQQLERLREYCLKDENGNLIRNEDGGYAIDNERAEECERIINEINNIQVQIPDLYFSLDELTPLQLTFSELEAFDQLIKM